MQSLKCPGVKDALLTIFVTHQLDMLSFVLLYTTAFPILDIRPAGVGAVRILLLAEVAWPIRGRRPVPFPDREDKPPNITERRWIPSCRHCLWGSM